MLKTEERDIGENGYQVTQLPGVQGRKLLVRLYKVLGPSIAALIDDTVASGDGVKTQYTADDIELSSVSAALSVLATKLKEDDLEHLCTQLGNSTQIRVDESDRWVPLKANLQNLVFAGAYKEMFQWLGFALEVNYGGFFDDVGGVGGFVSRLTSRKTPVPSDSPPNSTGKSGGSSPLSDTTSH